MNAPLTAEAFVAAMAEHQSDAELLKIQRYFKAANRDTFMGIRMGTVFDLAKAFIDMPPAEIDRLLDSDIHEVRAGALSIMAKQASRKKTPASRRGELFELYLRRHDRIDNWDLVDVAARHVVGPWLADKPRDVLYRLARSDIEWERRTATVATLHFIMKLREVDDALAIAEILVGDRADLMHKATGWALRTVGGVDRPRLVAFLDRHAATMPRTMLRYALEHFDEPERSHYLGLRQAAKPKPWRGGAGAG